MYLSFLLANCALFFNNTDQSIDLFLKASHYINNDYMLKSFMKLIRETTHRDEHTEQAKRLKTNTRKSINITRTNQMNNSMFDTSNTEIFDKLLVNKQNILQYENEDEILH